MARNMKRVFDRPGLHQCEGMAKRTGKRCREWAWQTFEGHYYCGLHFPYEERDRREKQTGQDNGHHERRIAPMEIIKAGPLGYCAGVSRAIDMAKAAAKEVQDAAKGGVRFPPTSGQVYSLGKIAHNEHVVKMLEDLGVVALDSDVMKARPKDGSHVLITAHGAAPHVFSLLHKHDVRVTDCTCPIVKVAQETAAQAAHEGHGVLIFGNPEHDEVRGLLGWGAPGVIFAGVFNDLFDGKQELKPINAHAQVLTVLSQTTQVPQQFADFVATLLYHHVDEFQEIRMVNTICPHVRSRLQHTRALAKNVDMMLVIGSATSANTMNLLQVAAQGCTSGRTFLVESVDDLVGAPGETGSHRALLQEGLANLRNGFMQSRAEPMIGRFRVGVTAGTSTPMDDVDAVIKMLEGLVNEG